MGFYKEEYSNNNVNLIVSFDKSPNDENFYDTDSVEEAMKHFNIFLDDDNNLKIKSKDEEILDSIGISQEEVSDYTEAVKNLTKDISDEESLENIILFPNWKTSYQYNVNDKCRYNDSLYKCIQGHTSQIDWIPSNTPALWVKISLEEYPEWVQPSGEHDAYDLGATVTHNGKKWQSNIQANVWEPGVYGWDEI